jgi:hypothetical protein
MTMTNLPAIVPFDQDVPLPAVFGDVSEADFNLAGGILSGFAVVSIRGKVWRARHKGDEHIIRDRDGEPKRRLQVVVVGVGPNVSKTYYAGAYVSGNTEAPDCASTDGIRPDAGVADPQASSCATCPMNQFGSRITEAGKKGKACQDNKRLAIVPADDIENAIFGGPMLLRIPPSSFQSLDQVSQVLAKNRVPFYGAVLDLAFDPDAEYPLLTFRAIGRITDPDMAAMIMEHRNSTVTESILFGNAGAEAALPVLPSPTKPAAAAKAATKPATKPATKAAPVQQEVTLPPATEGQAEDGAAEVEENTAPAEAPKAAAQKPAAAAPKTVAPSAESILGDLLAGL